MPCRNAARRSPSPAAQQRGRATFAARRSSDPLRAAWDAPSDRRHVARGDRLRRSDRLEARGLRRGRRCPAGLGNGAVRPDWRAPAVPAASPATPRVKLGNVVQRRRRQRRLGALRAGRGLRSAANGPESKPMSKPKAGCERLLGRDGRTAMGASKPNGSAGSSAAGWRSCSTSGVATGSRLNGSSKAGELRWLEFARSKAPGSRAASNGFGRSAGRGRRGLFLALAEKKSSRPMLTGARDAGGRGGRLAGGRC